jgi:hypothetical protein
MRRGGGVALVNYVRNRDAALDAAHKVGLQVVDEWRPSPPFFVAILRPEK